MQVPMTFIIINKKSKKSRRLVRGHQPPRRGGDEIGTRPHCRLYRRKEDRRQKFFSFSSLTTVQSVSARGGSCDQGWQNAYNSGLPFCRHFFDFLFVIIKAIGTCMQIFRRIYHKNNQKVFI